MRILPHRFPFLMVDLVEEVIPGERIVAYKNVSANEPYFQGHFPDAPIMPGVLLIEAMAQAGAILAYFDKEGMDRKALSPLLVGVDQVRLRRPVVPGDRVRVEMRMIRKRSTALKMRGAATVDGAVAAEGELIASTVIGAEDGRNGPRGES
ncbi:MAG: 3-hydroxyacyl-ACP dehydratase FabZ [Candidatus Methylomirabilis sp.]|nr:3-hydroxyacyl-ACP dehydratase FabZ [Deltaproteobacteria bacterium]